jgi:Cu/Zn superoxide dismutase
MNVTARARRGAPDCMPRRAARRAVAGAALAAAGALPLAALAASPAAAAPAARHTAASAAPRAAAPTALHLRLPAMPHGHVTFGRSRHHRLTVRVSVYGLTPGSSHAVDLRIPRHHRAVRFSTLTAASTGQAHATLHSHFSGHWPHGSELVIRMGTGGSRVARTPIAVTRRLRHPGRHAHRLIAIEVSSHGVSYGTPRGTARISYSASRQRLTVVVHASGLTPGQHAAHIHLGSCQNQGPVKYMLTDLVANRHGIVRRAVSVFTHVTQPIPARGWYLNIHQGNSKNILLNGQPSIFFRPLLCANIRGY